ncbi:cytochrome-c peroxidase [Flavobacteriaceae bacterium Ap0902]|nr:cytochrome-c peroxidase [Flavobacteriaceae bacterium Ap0902]
MKKFIIPVIFLIFLFLLSFITIHKELDNIEINYEEIVKLYKKPIEDWPSPFIDQGVEWEEFKSIPIDSNYFQSQELPKVILGKMLFFDPKLSKSNQISCSSCHDPEIGWADGRRVALGHNHLLGARNSLSLLNVAERKLLFWDGRVSSLEEQALAPIIAHNEMAHTSDSLVYQLNKISNYKPLFKNAYGSEKITFERITTALASFQKTIKSQPSRFDKFLERDYEALTDQEIYGMHIFRTKARCMNCHYGQYLTDESFHNIGLTYYKRKYQDLGRYNTTLIKEDVGKFRTPSLRDLLITRPWMHNGLFNDLLGVVNMYNSGMHMLDPSLEQKRQDSLYPVTDSLMKPLNLSKEERLAVVAFLKSLSGTKFKMRRPEYPRK